ncbi:MAG: GDP-mannose 4,6-dehydratase [Chloroflexota bacterium]
MRVLITGITGFVGSHLAEYALAKGAEVWGTIRGRSRLDNIIHIAPSLNLIDSDLRDASSVNNLVDQAKPELIFHLAAQSFVQSSFSAPAETLSNNILSELNILEAMRRANLRVPCLIAGSSEEYGLIDVEHLPIDEDCPLRPLSPYGVSKVAQDLLAFQYHKSYGLHMIRTRSFNHTGPRRGDVFVTSNFAKQIAEIEAGTRQPVIQVGNLDAERDWTDVRDIVEAYWLAVERGEPGDVYNICQGEAWKISKMLDYLISISSVTNTKVETDPRRLRPSDVPILVGDSTKFRRKTGWEPKIPLEQTFRDLLDYWRQQV